MPPETTHIMPMLPCAGRPHAAMARRTASEPSHIISHPQVSSVNANFERVVRGQTVREAVDDLFLRGGTVQGAAPFRTMQRQTNADHLAAIDALNERVVALEVALATLRAKLMQHGIY